MPVEASIAEAIKLAGQRLYHLHIADSNRAAPGRGHIDFKSVFEALKTIDYHGWLTMELLPPYADPFAALKGAKHEEYVDLYIKESIEYLQKIMEEVLHG